MKNKHQARQGDVLIQRVDSGTAKTKPQGRVILAHGEVTGHAHEVEDVAVVTAFDEVPIGTDRLTTHYMNLKASSRVVHQEHGPIPVTKGTYKITRQREYAPGAIRNVAD